MSTKIRVSKRVNNLIMERSRRGVDEERREITWKRGKRCERECFVIEIHTDGFCDVGSASNLKLEARSSKLEARSMKRGSPEARQERVVRVPQRQREQTRGSV
jgi:hypothetical protein